MNIGPLLRARVAEIDKQRRRLALEKGRIVIVVQTTCPHTDVVCAETPTSSFADKVTYQVCVHCGLAVRSWNQKLLGSSDTVVSRARAHRLQVGRCVNYITDVESLGAELRRRFKDQYGEAP